MNKRESTDKKPMGRPVTPKYLEPIKINASPEAVAKTIMRNPPKKDWRFLKTK